MGIGLSGAVTFQAAWMHPQRGCWAPARTPAVRAAQAVGQTLRCRAQDLDPRSPFHVPLTCTALGQMA